MMVRQFVVEEQGGERVSIEVNLMKVVDREMVVTVECEWLERL